MKQQTVWAAYLIVAAAAMIVLSGCGAQAEAAPVPPPVVDTGVDPEAWTAVPAGEFLMGLHQQEVELGSAIEMMVTDVTNAQFAVFLNEALADGTIRREGDTISGHYAGDEFHAHHHEEEIAAGYWPLVALDEPSLRLDDDGQTVSPQAGYENHPVTQVTWFGARAYCDYYGWRLPSEVEWEKGARGKDGRPYPWGDDIERGNANYYSSHDPLEEAAGSLGDTTPVGFYNGERRNGFQTFDSPGPYGHYDMAGNVWQWVGDVYEGTHLRVMRGGSKADYAYDLRTWSRNSARPDYAGAAVGFRCGR